MLDQAPPYAWPEFGDRKARHIDSPYRWFSRDEWAALRADTPLTLTMEDLRKLRATNDPISIEDVVAIYLPLSRLLALYVAATQGLFKATQRFLGAEDGKVPYRSASRPPPGC